MEMRGVHLISACWTAWLALSPAHAQAVLCSELGTLTGSISVEAYERAGNTYLQQHRTGCAASAFEAAVRLAPGDIALALQLGRTLVADHQFQTAREVLEKVVAIDPGSFDAQMALGAALHEAGEPTSALEHWEQAMRINPQSALALDWVAKARLEAGEVTAVIDLLRNVPRDESTEIDLLLARQRAGVLDQALPEALGRLQEHPEWNRLRDALAVTLVQRNRFDDALQVLSAARAPAAEDESMRLLKLQVMVLKGDDEAVMPLALSYLTDHPQDFEALYLAGLVHRRMGEYPAALTALRSAVELKPQHFDAVFNLGATEAALHRWRAAEADLRHAIALDANAPEPHFQLAAVLRGGDDLAGAKEQVQQYQRLQRQRAEHDRKISLAAQAAQRLSAGDPAGAVALYRELLTLDDGNAITQYNLAMACEVEGDRTGERMALEAAVRLNPKFALALNQLGYLQAEAGQTAAAEASLRSAVLNASGFAEAENNLGSLLATQGRAAEAEDAFRKALAAKPRSTEAWTNLAATLAERLRFGEARAAANQALQVDPQDATALALLRALPPQKGLQP